MQWCRCLTLKESEFIFPLRLPSWEVSSQCRKGHSAILGVCWFLERRSRLKKKFVSEEQVAMEKQIMVEELDMSFIVKVSKVPAILLEIAN